MKMIYFFNIFSELNCLTRKTEETEAVPLQFFFLAELDNSESFETNLFFLKKNPLVFAFDTFAIFRRIRHS